MSRKIETIFFYFISKKNRDDFFTLSQITLLSFALKNKNINMIQEKLVSLFYSPERNQTADLLKGLAVIFMIQVHLTENFLLTSLHKETFGIISYFLGGTPAAPVFMVVMGYFLSEKKSLSYYLERGTILFLGGILLNIGLNFYFLILYFQNQIINENPLQYIFGADILPFAGLSLIIIGLLKEIFQNKFYLYLIIAIISALISDIIAEPLADLDIWLKYVLSFIYGCSEWSYFPIFPWLFYPLLGFSFKLFYKKKQASISNQILITVVVLFCAAYLFITFKSSIREVIELGDYYHHGITLALWNTAFIIVWLFILNKVESYFGKNLFFVYIKWIGKNVTPFYVFQWLIIGNLAAIFYDSQNELQFFIWLVVVLFASSLLTSYYENYKLKKLSTQINE